MVTARATRSRRASRKASPTGRAANPKPTPAPVPAVAAPSDTPEEKEDPDDVWQEPPLLSPRPSYMEYPWIEKQPVCDGMLPLGTMPPANRRLKSKVVLTPAVKRKREREAAEKAAMEAARWPNRSSGSVPPAVTQAVVDAAVEKAERAGHATMARTLKRCFEESLEKPELAELLAAILSRSATVEQRDRFVGLVKNIRRHVRAETVATMATDKHTTTTTTTTTTSTSSTANNNIDNNNNATATATTTATNNNNKNSTTTITTITTAKTDERARATRSRSDSSSSLSSLGSLVEGSPFEFSAGPTGPPSVTQQGSGKAAVPKARSRKNAALQAVDQRRTSSASKRSPSQAGLDEADGNAVLVAKRQKLVRQYDLDVEESGERTSLTSLQEPGAASSRPSSSGAPSRLASSTRNPRPTITLKLRAPEGADADDEDEDDDVAVPGRSPSRRKASRALTPGGSQSRPLTPDAQGRVPRRVKTARVKKS